MDLPLKVSTSPPLFPGIALPLPLRGPPERKGRSSPGWKAHKLRGGGSSHFLGDDESELVMCEREMELWAGGRQELLDAHPRQGAGGFLESRVGSGGGSMGAEGQTAGSLRPGSLERGWAGAGMKGSDGMGERGWDPRAEELLDQLLSSPTSSPLPQ
eukprot:153394-Rhodomonas_salina.2